MKKGNHPSTELWHPSESFVTNSNLYQYLQWLGEHYNYHFINHHELWLWSVKNTAEFWESVWQYFDIQAHAPYTSVISGDTMPGVRWFEGSTLNYAEHIFKNQKEEHPAILFSSERHDLIEISWGELYSQVASMSAYLKEIGVKKGDRVVAFLPNIPEATIAFLATCSIGAIWSSCSPDFGANSVVDRFRQIEPKILFSLDGYQYNGKPFDKQHITNELCEKLPTLEKVIYVPYLNREASAKNISKGILWNDAFRSDAAEIVFEAVPFGHPIWVLYSSGTTGIPKAITHSQGGVLLEHYKYLAFHNDVHPGEHFFWFSTTGWMMWNFVQASLLMGATIVLYDGSPGFPNLNRLWELAEKAKIHHFGTSAPFLMACKKQGLKPGNNFDLSHLKSISSTGSPLPPEAFDWVYDNVKKDVWLCSMAGGTDVCTAWVGGCPMLPVYEGEIQCRSLGAALYAFDEAGKPVTEEVGELVVVKPMPSMPVYFWNYEGNKRYLSSYFDMYPGLWRHGDWIKITDRETLIIYGRSDATLNRKGIRIGTAEIYRALDKVPEIKDCLIVNLELEGGRDYMPLFVVLNEGVELGEALINKIKLKLRTECPTRHIPDEIVQISEVPYTISGKKLEAPVKKVLMGMPVEKAANVDSLKNPQALDFFVEFRKNRY